jgi:hypothetical protein
MGFEKDLGKLPRLLPAVLDYDKVSAGERGQN